MGMLLTHILRGLQLLFGLIILALGADGAAQWSGDYGYGGYVPSQTAFGIFLGVWTMLVVAYFMLAPRFVEAIAHPIIRLIVDAVTMLFWFSGFIAIAVLAGAWGAFDYYDYGYDAHSSNFYKVTAAMAAFGALEWVLFVVTTVFSALELFKGKSARTNHVAANPEVAV